MELRCLMVIIVIVTVYSTSIDAASVVRGVRDIPVRVLYEEPTLVKSIRNLIQQRTLKEDKVIPKINEIYPNQKGIHNLDEKVQLSREELGQAVRYLPVIEEDLIILTKSSQEQVNNEKQDLVQKVQTIIYNGLNIIKENVEKMSSTVNEKRPTEENWRELNKTLEEFLQNQVKTQPLRQDPPNQGGQFIQNIISGFQNFTGNFIQQFNQNQVSQRPGVNGTEDEQQPSQQGGFFQNLQNYFNGGITQIVSSINNLNQANNTQASVLGDTGVASTTPANFFSGIVNQVQQIFGGASQNLQITNLNQSDTGSGSQNQGSGGFFQGAINQINQVVNNLRPPTPPPNNQGDEGSQQPPSSGGGGPIQIFQQIGNQVGQAINQFTGNFGGGQSQQQKPDGQGDEGTSQQPQPPNNFIQNVGQVIQSINPFRPTSSTASPPLQSDTGTTSSNPIQNVGNQIQQLVQGQSNLTNNPIENIGNQVQQLVQSQQGQGSGGSNPIENVGNQIQQLAQGATQGNNPLQGLTPSTGQKQEDESTNTVEPKEISEKVEESQQTDEEQQKPLEVTQQKDNDLESNGKNKEDMVAME